VRLSDFVGQEEAKLGLALNAVDPRCGGLLLVGGRGSGKSALARLFRSILPKGDPFVELPLNVTEDSLLGGIDMEETLRNGKRTLLPGILSRAHGGAVFVDDINLLSPEFPMHLMESRERGEELIEREGLSETRECSFIVLATMNPDEGELSPHIADRFGLCAAMEDITGTAERMEIMRLSDGPAASVAEPDPDMTGRIASAMAILPLVRFSNETHEYLVDAARRNISAGHRGDLYLYYASRAFAALQGVAEVLPEHVDRVIGLVFAHRRLLIHDEDQQATDHEQHSDNKSEQQQGKEETNNQQNRGEAGQEESSGEGGVDGERERSGAPRESSVREEIMPVGGIFNTRRFNLQKDRLKRKAAGRRTRTRSKGRGGRYVKSLLQSPERDIAIDATLRACAPFQQARGRRDRLRIEADDLRFRQRERKMGHLVLFVVDGSGSMGAQRRMVETKGAIASLLMDCYQKRDRVAMIVFRKDRAELALPPTASVELAAKRLAVLPVGGKTPLAAGLLETYRLVRRTTLNRPETRILVVLITDGRGNQSISAAPPAREVSGLARLLAEQPQCDFIVIDTENKSNFLRADLALALARQLEACYYTTETLQAEYITGIVQSRATS
jgi:magnesium chelatase subunit D